MVAFLACSPHSSGVGRVVERLADALEQVAHLVDLQFVNLCPDLAGKSEADLGADDEVLSTPGARLVAGSGAGR